MALGYSLCSYVRVWVCISLQLEGMKKKEASKRGVKKEKKSPTQLMRSCQRNQCLALHTAALLVIISLYASSVLTKDLEDPYCNSKLLGQVYLFILKWGRGRISEDP